MPMKKINTGYARNLLKKSKEKIEELKKKLQALKDQANEESRHELPPAKEKKAEKEIKFSLSVESVVKSTIAILLVLGLVYILGIIQGVIITFLIALFLSAALNPAVDKLEKYKIPRPLGVIIMYILLLGIIVLMSVSLAPIIARQVTTLAGSIQQMILGLVNNPNPDSWIASRLQPYVIQLWSTVDQNQLFEVIRGTLDNFATTLADFSRNALGVVIGIFNGIFRTFLVLIITFFMIINTKATHNFFSSLFPHKYSYYISEKSKAVSHSIGNWVRGQTLLALTMGVISFLVFTIIGLDFALTLALVSAIAEFFPYLGPIITFASASLIAVNQDPFLLVWLIIAYVILQFVESNFLAPLIVGRSVGLSPIVVIFAVLSGAAIGYNLGGESIGLTFVGMILAVPIANIISIFIRDYTGKNK